MSNINGTTPLDFDELFDKTQNIDVATTVPGNTNVLGVLEVNGVPVTGVGGPFLPLDGSSAMTGDLDMGTNQLTNVSNIRVSSVSGDVVIGNSASTTGAAGSVAIGQASTADLDGVAIGQNCIATFASTCIGQNCTSVNAADVCIGFNAKSTAIPGNSVSVGNTSLCNAGRGVAIGDHTTAGGNTVAIGYFATANIGNAVALGNATLASFNGALALGNASGATATNAIAIGNGPVNTTANSCLIGPSAIVNIRPNNNNTCDLGTTANRFKDLNIAGSIAGVTNTRTADNIVSNAGASVNTRMASFSGTSGKVIQDSGIITADVFLRTGTIAMTGDLNMNNNDISNVTTIDGTGTVALGSTSATQVNIGHSGVSTIITGPASISTPIGSWYSTTAYLPAFTAATARLIPPTASTAGSLIDFTQSLGVLTYTGLVARDFHICYNISFLTGASLSNMTFFNSKNGSLVLGTQARIFFQVHPLNNATRVCVHFSDNITMATGNTVQLAAICALTTSAISFDFVSCNIFSTLT